MINRITFLLALCILATSCEKEDPEIPNEEEVITTAVLELTPANGGEAVQFTYTDLDGDGGDVPIIVNGILVANTSYTANLTLSNEQVDPSEDITEEILEEDEDHQIFYATTTAGLTISYEDMDSNGNPLGLATSWSTTDAASGTVSIILKHLPMKTLPSVMAGDITDAGGDTDIEITFNVTVQ